MQGSKTPKPYGTWPASVSAQLVTRSAPNLNHLQAYADQLFWVESRPWEAGRNVIMCRSAKGEIRDLLPTGFSHHSRVHEYGGMAYAVAEHWVYFVNGNDQRIYRLDLRDNSQPIPLTASGPRFADLVVDQQNQQLIAVCEEHQEGCEAENYLAAISLTSKQPSLCKLASGADFYAYPSISPDGQKLCWIEWNHPHMPWDCTQLWQANISEQALADRILVAGGDNNEAIFQPRWSPDNQLYYVSDRNNWWNIYRADSGIVFAKAAEFATPLWQFGMSTYDFIDVNTIGCLWTEQGVWHCGFISITSGELIAVDCDYTSMHAACCHQGRLHLVAGAAASADQLVAADRHSAPISIYAPSTLDIATGNLAEPETVNFASAGDQEVQAFFYSPANSHYRGQDDELPPVIVLCHGGPTGATHCGLNLKIQYWTNRGFAVVDINYRGSTGFGRVFRQALTAAWGIADVEDAQYALNYLIKQQKVDPRRCIIRGGSAGGYTVLSALTFTHSFQAGASLYGIGDLETLARDTHKFESRYLDKLIGPYPENKHIYQQRSPIHHAQKLSCPVIFLQGLEDKVVPPNQAEMMVNILKDKGIEVDHVTFPDEGHGFRKADNIIRALEAELAFYRRVFKLPEGQ